MSETYCFLKDTEVKSNVYEKLRRKVVKDISQNSLGVPERLVKYRLAVNLSRTKFVEI